MKIPQTAPRLQDVIQQLADPETSRRILDALTKNIGPAPKGNYIHWDTLRHKKPPHGLSHEDWWAAIKFARTQINRPIPLLDSKRTAFTYSTPDPILELLHEIDRDASGRIAFAEAITNPQTKDRYVQSSLIEEAITSSQLEGAAATREQAKNMIRSGRKPTDRSEQMILNNYRAMQFISKLKDAPLSPELVFEIHQVITERSMPAAAEPPYLRKHGDGIAVWDDRDNKLLHRPPKASEIDSRMQAMCDFANNEQTGVFMHPAIKAITLHFWLAYDHPFIDGNGRTARALFYWSMLNDGYWLIEFISISSILRKAPAKYGRSFLYTETDENDLTYFIDEQLRVIRRAIDQLHEYLSRKIEEVRKTEQLLRASVELNHRQLAILSHALRHPGIRYSSESHRTSHDVTYQTARTDLLDLVAKELLIKSRSGKAFAFTPAPDLYERLQEFS